jgi:hypothetical protein
MNRIPVSSSVLNSIGHEAGTLEIQFKTGKIYQYIDVPESTYQSLMSAPSKTAYYSSFIKPFFRCRRIV